MDADVLAASVCQEIKRSTNQPILTLQKHGLVRTSFSESIISLLKASSITR